MLDNEGVNPRCICLHLRRAEAVRQEASHGWRYPHVTMRHMIIFWYSAGVLVGGCVLCHRPSTGVLVGGCVLCHRPSTGVLVGGCVLCHRPSTGVLVGGCVLCHRPSTGVLAGGCVLCHRPSTGVLAGGCVLCHRPSTGVLAGGCVLCHRPSTGVLAGGCVLCHRPSTGVLAGGCVLCHRPSTGVLVGGCVLCHRPSTGVLAGVNVLKWLWPWKRLWSYTLTLEWLLTLKRAVHWCTTPDLQETIDLERGSTSAHYSWPSSNHWPWKGMQYCTEMLGALLTLEGAAILLTNLGERNPWPWSDHWPWVVVLHADLEVVILTLKGAMVLHADL